MQIAKRIVLFVLTNLLIIITISIVLNVLGVRPYLQANGIDYQALAVFCLVWGMGGAFISLLLSRFMAKMFMRVKVIDPHQAGEYTDLVNMVTHLAQAAGLPRTPEIGVYQSNDINAFATGPSKRRSLVAFSTGLLGKMSREEIEGVAGHEIAHIQNGDMVTMTLIQGVINAFVMFLARAIAFVISQNSKGESRHGTNYFVVFILEIVFSLLGSIVVAWFSRQREFRADAGSAQIAGREKMIKGLERLKEVYGRAVSHTEEAPSLAALKISGKSGGFLSLFSTHPPLDERIARLRAFS